MGLFIISHYPSLCITIKKFDENSYLPPPEIPVFTYTKKLKSGTSSYCWLYDGCLMSKSMVSI